MREYILYLRVTKWCGKFFIDPISSVGFWMHRDNKDIVQPCRHQQNVMSHLRNDMMVLYWTDIVGHRLNAQREQGIRTSVRVTSYSQDGVMLFY